MRRVAVDHADLEPGWSRRRGAVPGGAFPHRAARALAEEVGAEFVELAGDHAGFGTRPRAFAASLVGVLGG
jgi:hypothetical protein